MHYSHYIEDLFFNIQYGLRPTFSVEVGAYDGSFSKHMKLAYPPIRSYAFEASPHNFAKFGHDAIEGVSYLNMAVADHVGETQFWLQDNVRPDVGNNSVMPRIQTDQTPVTVPCTTLDAFFVDSGLMSDDDTACLWVDVEGASGLILPAAKKFLAKTTSILIEVEHQYFWENQWLSGHVDEFLQEQGFKPLARDYEFHPTQENYLYVK